MSQNRGPEKANQSLLLVSPPFMRPTCPPLGPASLKAFLKQEMPQVTIRCIDLNLEYFYLALEWLEKGAIKLKLYQWDEAKTAEMVKRAFDFLGSVPPHTENIGEFHKQSTVFLSFENIFNAFIAEMALRSLVQAPVPSGMQAFLESLCARVVDSHADVVGISVMFDLQMPLALLLAKKVKAHRGSKVILGGAKFGVEPSHGRLFSEPVVQRVKGEEYKELAGDFIDGIISGEGEVALLHILRSKTRSQFEASPNLTFKKDGHIIRNEPAVLEDLDKLPCPDFSDFPLERYMCPERVLPVLTARGCPWGKCVFCTHHHSYKRYRQRSLEMVIEDFKHLMETHNVRLFNIYDEMIPPKRFRKMAARIIKDDLGICYSAYGKPVKAFDRDTLRLIHDSGCGLMLWGVESASQRVLDLMNKGTMVKDVEEVIKTSAEEGIKNLVFIMFGFPGEGEEEFLKTLFFLQKNSSSIHALSKGLFRLMEGSEIACHPESFGITKVRRLEVQPFKSRLLVFDTKGPLTPEKAETLFKKNLRHIESIGLSPRFGTYREHLLVLASWGKVRKRIAKND